MYDAGENKGLLLKVAKSKGGGKNYGSKLLGNFTVTDKSVLQLVLQKHTNGLSIITQYKS